MTLIAEQTLDLLGSDEGVLVRLFAPVQVDAETWSCRHEIGSPIAETLDSQGVTSLQALALALRNLSAALYSHPLYKQGKLGAYGEFAGYLGVPAPSTYHQFAPFPF